MQKPSELIHKYAKEEGYRHPIYHPDYVSFLVSSILNYLDEQVEQQAKKAEECKHDWFYDANEFMTNRKHYTCIKCRKEKWEENGTSKEICRHGVFNWEINCDKCFKSEPVKECEHKNMAMFLGIGKCPDCGIIVQNSVIQENSEQTSLVPLDYEKAIEFSSIDHNLSYREKCIIKQICQKFGQPRVLSVEEILFICSKHRRILLDSHFLEFCKAIHEALKEKNKN